MREKWNKEVEEDDLDLEEVDLDLGGFVRVV